MRPPMRQKVTAHFPVLDPDGKPVTDKYGKPVTYPKDSKARVQFKTRLIKDSMGQEHEVNVEIDIPTAFNPDSGMEIEFVTAGGDKGKGTIKAKDEALNLAGNKVYFRTVFVDGR